MNQDRVITNEKENSEKGSIDGVEEETSNAYKVLMVAIYCLVSVAYGFIGASMGSYSETVHIVYKESIANIDLTSSFWSFGGIICGIPANYYIRIIGTRKSLTLAAFLFMVGMLVKNFLNYDFNLVHLGLFLAGFGGPFCNYSTAHFATEWFSGPKVNTKK